MTGARKKPTRSRVVMIVSTLVVGLLVASVAASPAVAKLAMSSVVSSYIDGASRDDDPPASEADVNAAAAAKAERVEGLPGQTVAANFLDGTSSSSNVLAAPSLWWVWTAPRTANVAFFTHGSEIDTVLAVYTGTANRPALVRANDDDGDVSTSALILEATAGATYFIEVRAKDREPGLVTLGWYDVGAERGQLATSRSRLVSQKVSLGGAGAYEQIPISTNTGEKPQSKIWQHAGSWWAVLPSTAVSPAGTWLWRLDGNRWVNVLHLSDATAARADARNVGGVTHVLLHGPESSLISIEHVPGEGTYQPWSGRPFSTPVAMPGSETATIDVDSRGRLWLAYDSPASIDVRYSDAPYTAFSEPITVASGVKDDDIAAVTTLAGRIGVMWSNQTTRRFGFRSHVDGAAPTEGWTDDEVPAGRFALSVGRGMADDHINFALASDGTLFTAVKTSYNSDSHTVIALLVRHPNGSWEPPHEVDRAGTRPIVLLNEQDESVTVLYTENERLGDIVRKSSSYRRFDFSSPPVTVLSGSYNNVTSTKSRWSGQAVVLAASESHAAHAVLDSRTTGSVPLGNLDSVVGTSGGISVTGWTIDPDTTSPIYVWVTIDGVGRHLYANVSRPDVENVYPSFGSRHGFHGTLQAEPGVRTVCVTSSNVGPGAHLLLGCNRVVVD